MSLEATRVSRVTGIVFFLPPLNRIAVCALAECSHSFIHEVAFGPSFREPLGGVGRGWLVGALGGLCRSVGRALSVFFPLSWVELRAILNGICGDGIGLLALQL